MIDNRDLLDGIEQADPAEGTYPVLELAREHRHNYRVIVGTKSGDKAAVILRKCPLRMRQIIDLARARMYPGVRPLIEKARFYAEKYKGVDDKDIPAEDLEDMDRVAYQLAVTDMSPLAVIVSPALGSMDEWERLYEMLDEQGRARIIEAVRWCMAVIPPEQVDGTPESIAERYGIEVVDRELIENMTVSQCAYWSRRISEESRAVEALRNGHRGDGRGRQRLEILRRRGQFRALGAGDILVRDLHGGGADQRHGRHRQHGEGGPLRHDRPPRTQGGRGGGAHRGALVEPRRVGEDRHGGGPLRVRRRPRERDAQEDHPEGP